VKRSNTVTLTDLIARFHDRTPYLVPIRKLLPWCGEKDHVLDERRAREKRHRWRKAQLKPDTMAFASLLKTPIKTWYPENREENITLAPGVSLSSPFRERRMAQNPCVAETDTDNKGIVFEVEGLRGSQ
jgi:hypothetical protein